jgi:L-fuculose-phosphate aldolase
MHLFAYQRRPDCRACVHSHPPYSTAFAVAGIPLAEDILPEVVVFVGGIPLAEYAPPGTPAVPESLEPFIAEHNAFLLRNHGLLTIGRSMEEALHRHETVEHFARIVHLARQLGNVSRIPAADFARLQQLREHPGDKPETR